MVAYMAVRLAELLVDKLADHWAATLVASLAV
jgi:hypothetical protein